MSRKVFVLVLGLILALLTGSLGFAQDKFVFGMVLVGPKNDGGWSQAHFDGGLYVEEKLPGTKMIFFEELNPAAHPEATLRDVVADMVDQGGKIIFTTSDEFEEDTTEVAREFPDTVLVNISGDDVALGGTPSNLGNFTGQLLISREIAGCTAALKTKTGKVGLVGPLINYETRRDQSSAYLGARYCWENYLGRDPKELEFIVKWIGFWFYIPGVTLDPTEEAHAMIDGGADVVISGIDTLEPLKVVEQRRQEGLSVSFIGTDSRHVCEVANPEEACLGTQHYNWGPGYLENVKAAKDGTWEPTFKWNGPDWDDINNIDTSHVGFVYGEGLGVDERAIVDKFIAELADFATAPGNENHLPLWCGPLNYQDGSVLVAEGQCLPAFQLQKDGPSVWYLEQLLEGMTGASK